MTRNDDPRLGDRHPEFARMSLRPGIGLDAMWEISSVMMALGLDETEGDVPVALRHGNRSLPLGRYLRRALREMIGRSKNAPPEILEKLAEEVRPLWESASALPAVNGFRTLAFKNALSDLDAQKVLNAEARAKIHKQKRQL